MCKFISLGVFLLILSTGCTTMKNIKDNNPNINEVSDKVEIYNVVKVGDYIEIATVGGDFHSFKVADVNELYIVSESGDSFKVDDVAALKSEHYSFGKTALLVGGVGLSVAAVASFMGFVAAIFSLFAL